MLKRILLVTDGFFHPPIGGRWFLHQALQQMDGFTFRHVRSLENLPADMLGLDALVLHFHHKRISPAALDKLSAFVKNGGGILALHAAAASFKQSLPYFQILGGRFTGHAAVQQIHLHRRSDKIFSGIADFSVRDELYLYETSPEIQVHFSAHQEGKEIPVVWTYLYGKGRVCYACPGHLTTTLRHPEYQNILRRGLSWVCAGQSNDPETRCG